MITLSDSVWNSLKLSEGYRTTIYKESKGIPTVGLGLALIKINSSGAYYIDTDMLNNLEMNTVTVNTALNQALQRIEGDTSVQNPFVTGTELLNDDTRIAEESKYGSISESMFKSSIWPDIFETYLTLSSNAVGTSIWNALSVNEQTAILRFRL
jgi:GH24 family phage-related lysozyme (muramidase)